jgi:hypothetical protein
MIALEHQTIIKKLASTPSKNYTSLYLTSLIKELFPEYRSIENSRLEKQITVIIYS